MKSKFNVFMAALGLVISMSACAAQNGNKTTALSEQKGPVETFMEGCKTELNTYCKNVTPGEGRLLACIFAHEDKLSARCDYALYDAANQLERAVAALSYAANECDDDLVKFCSDIEPGEGRILNCLKQNEKQLSKRCTQALHDVGLK